MTDLTPTPAQILDKLILGNVRSDGSCTPGKIQRLTTKQYVELGRWY